MGPGRKPRRPVFSQRGSFSKIGVYRGQGQIISLTGLSALSIALWKPNVIVSSLALDFESEETGKVISL